MLPAYEPVTINLILIRWNLPKLFLGFLAIWCTGCAASSPDSSRQPNSPMVDGRSPGSTATHAGGAGENSPAQRGAVIAPPTAGGKGGMEPAATLVDARPAALINGESINWGDLRPFLNEAAGAEVLQDAILDRKIDAALIDAGIVISEDDLAAERKMLLESLNTDPNVAMRLLDELRDRQHLGKNRFNALMRRNAGLRALVRPGVKINEAAIQSMYDMLHGPKRQARIMILPTLAAAEGAMNLIKSGVSFADVAVEMSVDSSAARGGLLEPISQADPAYPEAVRKALFSLNIGEMSEPILLDDRYAIILLVKRVAPDATTLDEARPTLLRLVRVNQERLLMDRLARTMLADASVTIFDDSLNDAWQRQSRNRR